MQSICKQLEQLYMENSRNGMADISAAQMCHLSSTQPSLLPLLLPLSFSFCSSLSPPPSLPLLCLPSPPPSLPPLCLPSPPPLHPPPPPPNRHEHYTNNSDPESLCHSHSSVRQIRHGACNAGCHPALPRGHRSWSVQLLMLLVIYEQLLMLLVSYNSCC